MSQHLSATLDALERAVGGVELAVAPRVLLVTPTHPWKGRETVLPHLIDVVKEQSSQSGLPAARSVFWTVVEDGPKTDDKIAEKLRSSGLPHEYFAHEGKHGHDWGNPQRNQALERIVDNKRTGVVHFLDDDVKIGDSFMSLVRQTKPRAVSVMAIANLGPHGVERPLYDKDSHDFAGWDAGWASRRFPVDMNAFSFDAALLDGLRRPLFDHEGFGGETEMVERLISKPEELQPLGNLCSEVSVLHNGWKDPARVREAERREADAAVERPLDLERAVRQACEREATSARIR